MEEKKKRSLMLMSSADKREIIDEKASLKKKVTMYVNIKKVSCACHNTFHIHILMHDIKDLYCNLPFESRVWNCFNIFFLTIEFIQ